MAEVMIGLLACRYCSDNSDRSTWDNRFGIGADRVDSEFGGNSSPCCFWGYYVCNLGYLRWDPDHAWMEGQLQVNTPVMMASLEMEQRFALLILDLHAQGTQIRTYALASDSNFAQTGWEGLDSWTAYVPLRLYICTYALSYDILIIQYIS